jgi:membrane protein involved in colicin uptake
MITLNLTDLTPEQLSAIGRILAEKPAAEKPAAEKPAAEKPAAEKPVAEKPAAEKPVATTAELSLETVRGRLTELSRDGKSAAVKQLLSQFGASKLTELDPSKFAEVYAAAGSL